MSDSELTRKLSELFDMKLVQWNSVSSRLEELKQMKKEIQNVANKKKYSQFKRVIKALNHPARIKILLAIDKGVICPCELEYIIELAQATISHHLTILEEAGLISKNRKGKWALLTFEEIPTLKSIIPF